MSIEIVADPSGLWSPLTGWSVSRSVADVIHWEPSTQPRLWVQGSRSAVVAANISHLWGWSIARLPSPPEAVGVALGCFWPYGGQAAIELLRVVRADPFHFELQLKREVLIDHAMELSGGLTFWHLPAGRPEHLAGLLRALFDREPGEPLPEWAPLAQALCLLWEREAGPISGLLYRYNQLGTLLKAWVLDGHKIPGLQPIVINGLERLPKPFPDPVPRLARNWVRESWQRALSRMEDDRVFETIIRLEPSRQAAVEEAAQALAEMAMALGSERTPPQALAWLERMATALLDADLKRRVKSLRAEQRPPSPSALPDEDADLKSLIRWGTQYILYRAWERQRGQGLSAEEAEQCRRFGERYLRAYQEAVGQPRVPARSTAVWERVRDLLEADEAVVWVVIDGLPYAYWSLLQGLLLQERSGLTLAKEPQVCGAVIPTDTDYAKWALYAGRLPAAAERLAEPRRETLQRSLEPWAHRLIYWTDRGISLSQGVGPALSKMEPGDCIVLDFLALDKEYSKYPGDPTVLDRYLSNTLGVIAEQILIALDLIPAYLEGSWALVVSADHGAVLDPLSPLPGPLPRGQARGRLAVGLAARPADPWMALPLRDCGLPTDTPLSVCLGPHRFGVQGVPAAPICGQHGSLWPDEVLIPLAVFQRGEGGLQPLQIEVAEGRAAAGAQGTIRLQLRNPNLLLAVTDIAVELTAFGDQSRRALPVKRLEGGQLSSVESVKVDRWPSHLPPVGEPVGKIYYRVGGVEQMVDLIGNFYAETIYDSGFDALFQLEG